MITAPYNFVPLNKEVFYPSWAEKVSHDIPFEDGESGIIDITITAKSPIFIRDHEKQEEFCHHKYPDGKKEFYIPATSVKGMVRNVLEIMSFSKIQVDKKYEKALSVRDMTPDKYCKNNPTKPLGKCKGNDNREDRYNHPIVATAKKFGLLNLKNGKFMDYGKIVKIHHKEIKKVFNYNYRSKSIYEKYTSISPLSEISVSEPYETNRQYFSEYDTYGTNAKLFLNEHIGEGVKEKKYEFVLIDENRKRPQNIDNSAIKNFKTVYFQGTYKGKNPQDWTVGEYWESRYDQNSNIEIPVFYIDIDGQRYFGLTQIFKLPYHHTFLDTLPELINQNGLDLSETIFGTVNDKINFALKGRVQFSHYKAIELNETDYENKRVIEQVLGEPKPTYYPSYIEQDNLRNNSSVRRYKTLMDDDSKIRGWKRYPLRKNIKEYDLPINDNGDVNHDVATKFKPLNSGTVFQGKIRFHNLKKAEIGALLSALTFHGNEESNYHNIGMAKALGYGKIKIDIKSIKTTKNRDKKEYLKTYETYMLTFDDRWLESEQLKELFAMTDISITNDNRLIYQSLDNSDFSNDKKQNLYLKKYSDIVNYNFNLVRSSEIFLDELMMKFINKLLENIDFSLEDFCNYMNGNYSLIPDEDTLYRLEELYDCKEFREIANSLEKFCKNNIDGNEKVRLWDFLLSYHKINP